MSIDPYQRIICRNCWKDWALNGYYRCNFCLNVGEITVHGMKIRYDDLLKDFWLASNGYFTRNNNKSSIGALKW